MTIRAAWEGAQPALASALASCEASGVSEDLREAGKSEGEEEGEEDMQGGIGRRGRPMEACGPSYCAGHMHPPAWRSGCPRGVAVLPWSQEWKSPALTEFIWVDQLPSFPLLQMRRCGLGRLDGHEGQRVAWCQSQEETRGPAGAGDVTATRWGVVKPWRQRECPSAFYRIGVAAKANEIWNKVAHSPKQSGE